MNFNKMLLQVGGRLSKEEMQALTFLCDDLMNWDPDSVNSPSSFFSRLKEQGLLSAEEPELLTELLLTIQRTKLVRDMGLSARSPASKSLISPYRKMLYDLSEEVTSEDLKKIKFLLAPKLPRKNLTDATTLEIFLEMERRDLLSETDLSLLEYVLQEVYPLGNEKIRQLKCLRENPENRPVQERNLTVSFPSQTTLTTPLHPTIPSEDKLDQSLPTQEKSGTTDNDEEVLKPYPMTGAKRGFCVIVNNYDFTKSKRLLNRDGTMIDEENLKKVFSWLGFVVETHTDCDKAQILDVLWEVSRRDHSQMDCFACCILSHGEEGLVHGVDGGSVRIHELKEPFEGHNCKSLVTKPKLFFIQACQGTSKQTGVMPDDYESDGVCTDAMGSRTSIPYAADFLLGLSTVPSFVSFRSIKEGSWYMQSLCRNLVQLVPKGCDLVTIMTKVNADVGNMTVNRKKQMPQPAFTLLRRVVFPIPSASPPQLISQK